MGLKSTREEHAKEKNKTKHTNPNNFQLILSNAAVHGDIES